MLSLALLTLSTPAEAVDFRVGQVPNGTEYSCNLCHTAGGGSPRNNFGMQVEDTLDGENVDWSAVFDLDADGDGATNGEELGDPDGDGTADPAAVVTDPNDPNEFPSDDEPATDDPADTGEPVEDGGGCNVAPISGASFGLLSLVALFARRRRV